MSNIIQVTLVVHFEVKPEYLQEALELFAEHESNGTQGSWEPRVSSLPRP